MPGMSGSGGPSMLLLRIVLAGTLAAVFAWSAIRTLRMGDFMFGAARSLRAPRTQHRFGPP